MSDWFRRNRHLYPEDWADVSHAARERAGHVCEACGTESRPRRILTVDHLDHNPQNNNAENLLALCQRCHLIRQGQRPKARSREEALERLKRRLAIEASQQHLVF